MPPRSAPRTWLSQIRQWMLMLLSYEHMFEKGRMSPASLASPSPAGSYRRLSVLTAEHDPISPANQRRLNHQAAARNGECILPEFEFEDFASAYKDTGRPGFDDAVKALLDGRIKTLYVAKVDRLSRRGTGQVGLLLDRLEQVGGRIVFVGDNLDSSQPGARQVIAILSEQARAESDAIRWRMKQWHASNRREGLWRKKRPYGYRVVDRKLQPDPREAAVVGRIVAEFLAGTSLRNIATRLNRDGIDCPNAVKHDEAKAAGRPVRPLATRRWSYLTIRAILCAPSLAALISHEGQLVRDDKGDPIVAGTGIVTLTERIRILLEFERRGLNVRDARDSERTGIGRPPKYLLTTFVHCSLCTAAMARHVGRRGRDPAAVYRCARHGRGHQCRGVSIDAEDVERESCDGSSPSWPPWNRVTNCSNRSPNDGRRSRCPQAGSIAPPWRRSSVTRRRTWQTSTKLATDGANSTHPKTSSSTRPQKVGSPNSETQRAMHSPSSARHQPSTLRCC